uniref:glycogenin glucosyltransferase n=1 Tax=Felis catus TaxID=9685 RepID=A0ABI7YE94_FELCA
ERSGRTLSSRRASSLAALPPGARLLSATNLRLRRPPAPTRQHHDRSGLCDTDHKRCLCQRSLGLGLLSETAQDNQEAGRACHTAGLGLHEVLANIDDLFEREELSAAPDPGWPDCFNSGVFVYQPSVETYNQLLHLASEQGSFDGGDQGLLNTFFSGWATTDIRKHLPFIYNLSSISIYSYLPAFKAFGANAKVVHFLGRIKPWNYTYDPKTKSVKSESHDPTMTHPEFLNLWWDIFTTNVLPLLQQFGLVKDPHSYLNVEGVSGAVSHLSLGEIPATAQPFVSSEERKERWEQGQADYMGADSFDNIKRKLDTYLQ